MSDEHYEDGEEDEEEKSEITLTPFVWEQIHHFHSNADPWSLIHHRNDVVQTPPPPPPTQHDVVFPPVNHQNDVVPPAQIHPSDVVFPPVNHEDLDVREIELDANRGRSAATPPVANTPRRRTVAGPPPVLRVLGLRISGIVSLIRSFVANRGGVMWMYLGNGFAVAAVAGPVALLWYYYLRLRRVRREESVSQLIRVIKEKDEKIHQLLYQIARMNELLLASHHGVPISGTASSSNHGKF